MDRCVVLVDAGYLMGAAATLLAANGLRSSVTADYGPMLASIVHEAQQQTGLPVLRVMWYDAAPEARPTQTHLTLVSLPDVKVRLGVLVRHGTRTEQKGVDSFLQRDLTTLARNGAVADIVLIGGDEDLRRGVVEAQDYGVKVHLWGVWAAAPRYNQAPTLIAEADRRFVLSEEWVRSYIRLRPGAMSADDPALAAGLAGTPRLPNQTSAVALSVRSTPVGDDDPHGDVPTREFTNDPAGHSASGAVADPRQDLACERGASFDPASHSAVDMDREVLRASPPFGEGPSERYQVPGPGRQAGPDAQLGTGPDGELGPTQASLEHVTPAIMRHFSPPHLAAGGGPTMTSAGMVTSTHPSGRGPALESATGSDAIPTLAEVTTQPEVWRDNEEDTTVVLADPEAVGERYGRRWVARASASHRRALLALYPKLPRGMDGEVLRFAFTRGIDTWEDESAKFAIRAAVWRAVGANGSASSATSSATSSPAQCAGSPDPE